MNISSSEVRHRFRTLHAGPELFVMPNPWDVGSARLLSGAGFVALATTSAGLAWSMGADDYAGAVSRDVLVSHVAAITAAVDVPLNVDSERCFADDPAGVAVTVGLLHDAGAAGCSIEDYDPATDAIDPLDVAVERVAAAASAAHRPGDEMVLTARCENFLHGITDLDATIARLVAYRDAGADCLYAPGLSTVEQIGTVVEALAAPINVLLWPGGPTVAALADAGARRVSVGGSLASVAYRAALDAGRELLEHGTARFLGARLTPADRRLLSAPRRT